MAKQRFTFQMAKEQIKVLEAKVEELEGVLADEFQNAKDDIVEDVRNWGYGDTAIVVGGFILGFILGAILL